MVLFILAMLACLAMPAMQSAFTEQAVRKDSHQLALMVKTAMIQSAEQHRAYVIDLSQTTMALHPAGVAAEAADDSAASDDDQSGTDAGAANNSAMADVNITSVIDPDNKLLTADPVKADTWIAMPDGTQWVFQPGELCPATRVRLARGEAWIEMSFGALTGNVEDVTDSFP
jgi:type II secretory pathway pseudopilin PulG